MEQPKNGRTLVWECNFNTLDEFTEKWQFDKTMYNPDFEYINDSKHAYVENHEMVLKLDSADEPQKICSLPYGISTKGTMNFRYGYVEMRAKVPFRHGAWPSFWMKTQTPFAKSRYMAETDIFEVFSSENKISPNLHKWYEDKHVMLPSEVDGNTREFAFKELKNLNNEYHIYGFEWTAEKMAWYIDGGCYFTVKIDGSFDFGITEVSGMDGFHDFAFVIINNEAFSEGTGCWCSEKLWIKKEDIPIYYHIDYVRLFQNKENEKIKLKDEISR